MRPEGDNTGNGIKNQLGRPTRLGTYAVLVREAVQNSWDARLHDDSVSIRFILRALGDDAESWRSIVGGSSLPAEQSKIFSTLSPETPMLIISDRGTSGLGGPLRSDRVNESGEAANFVQFMRNVGEARDSPLGGGTFGYGKGIFYKISRASAILVDSQNRSDPDSRRRLMGAALGEAFNGPNGRRFTGRHWWGVINDAVPDPILNDAASEISSRLGLPGFSESETGTDIVIISPELDFEDDSEDLQSLGERLRGHIYWNLWPKFATKQRPKGIDFSITVNDSEVPFPDITDVPVLRNFAKALDTVAQRKGTDYRLKKYEPAILGEFGVDHVFTQTSPADDEAVLSVESFAPLQMPYRHIARMRQAELVVDYQSTAPMPAPEMGYAGVFRASKFADDAFADAEPPTHDDWATAGLMGSSLGIVRGAKSFIDSETNDLVATSSGARTRLIRGLGKLSSELGGVILPGLGDRVGTDQRRTSPRSGVKRKPKYVLDRGQLPLEIADGTPCVQHLVRVEGSIDKSQTLKASAYVKLANGRREDPASAPKGSDQPKFVGWFTYPESKLIETRSELQLEGFSGELVARFQALPGAVVRTVIEARDV